MFLVNPLVVKYKNDVTRLVDLSRSREGKRRATLPRSELE